MKDTVTKHVWREEKLTGREKSKFMDPTAGIYLVGWGTREPVLLGHRVGNRDQEGFDHRQPVGPMEDLGLSASDELCCGLLL